MKKILGILLVLAVLLCNVALADNLEDSKAMFDEAVATLMTTDNHPMLAPGVTFDVPAAVGIYEELEKLFPDRIICIDATQSINDIEQSIIRHIRALIGG